MFEEEEFTEKDVLPFLLQAQDIISKLESRVIELEGDLTNIYKKYEKDKNEWIIGLTQKDQYITYLKSKLERIEFNTKETITVLSDLMTQETSMNEQVSSTVQLSLNYLRQTDREENTFERKSRQSNENNGDDLEEGEYERRLAATNEWKNMNDSALCLPNYNNDCLNCKQLLNQLDDQVEKQAYLKRDIGLLASNLTELEKYKSSIEKDKQELEKDIQDITASLFLILNEVLINEMNEKENTDLWENRNSKLNQLKDLFIQLDSITNQKSTIAVFEEEEEEEEEEFVTTTCSSISSLDHILNTNNLKIHIDGILLLEFKNHLKLLSSSKELIPSSPFIKRVFSEDIEPCLFFQQSTTNTWWKSSWFKKKLLNSIISHQCEIQTYQGLLIDSNSASHISNASTASNDHMPPKLKCCCCNVLRVCEFKLRIQQDQPWLSIDRFCKDRILSVYSYYNFVANLKYVINSPILILFKQILNHRKKMNLARIGSVNLLSLDDMHRKRNSTSVVLDHSGQLDNTSTISISEYQGLENIPAQIIIVN